MNGKILLTSTGLTSANILSNFKSLITTPSKQSVAIVTTAAVGKEKNKYSQLAKKQFEDIGFGKIDFVDLETCPQEDFSHYEIIYVCGGNTFILLKAARISSFKQSIENLLKRNGIYIGVSAGSIIIGPSIAVANEIDPDPNPDNLTDLSGLNIIDTIILPHYSFDLKKEALRFEKKYNTKIQHLRDTEALLIEGESRNFIT